MRNFLLVLTFMLSVLGFGQTASAQVCEGTANLDYGEYVWSVGDGQWKLLKDPRVYCDVTCPDSSELVLLAGDAHYCSDDGGPTCEGVIYLEPGEEIWRGGPNMWKTEDGSTTYCEAQCEDGSALQFVSGDTYTCEVSAPSCAGTVWLDPGESIWGTDAGHWQKAGVSSTYCYAECRDGSDLLLASGNTFYCEPEAPSCEGTALLEPGERAWKFGDEHWETAFADRVYCDAECSTGEPLTFVSGDTYICEVSTPSCEGTVWLDAGESVWKTEDGHWQRSGDAATYCDASCEDGSALKFVSGDTYTCEVPAPKCEGTVWLDAGESVWKTEEGHWQRSGDAATYCDASCEDGSALKFVSGDTYTCEVPAPKCEGTVWLDAGESVWKTEDGHWQRSGDAATYCNASCEDGSALQFVSGDTYTCEVPAPKCEGTVWLDAGESVWQTEDGHWQRSGDAATYCDASCEDGSALKFVSGDTYTCEVPAPKCEGTVWLDAGESVWQTEDGHWQRSGDAATYCDASCEDGSALKFVSGDTYTCEVPAPKCEGTVWLDAGESVWKTEDGHWQRSGDAATYCDASCEDGSALKFVSGDTYTCEVPAPKCEGTVWLDAGESVWKTEEGHWQRSGDSATYCDASCEDGSALKFVSGDTYTCEVPAPKCEGTVWLDAGESVWKTEEGHWQRSGDAATYCDASCEDGSALKFVSGDTYTCEVPAPKCEGTVWLDAGESVWKTEEGHWQRSGDAATYCDASCEDGSALQFVSGDTYTCEVPAPKCEGTVWLDAGESVWKTEEGHWQRSGDSATYCDASCEDGSALKFVSGDTYTCEVPAPKCEGTVWLDAGESVWKTEEGHWQRSGDAATYCDASCEDGSALKFVSGDTYTCEVPAPKCEGTVTLNPGDEVIRRAAKRWKVNGDDTIYCAASCSDGSSPIQKDDRTYHCKPEAPKCEGTVTLNPGDEVIRRAAKRWKVNGDDTIYCAATCSDGSSPIQKDDRTYHCKPEAPKCEGTVTLNPGDEVIRRAAKRWKVNGDDTIYCAASCSDGSSPIQKDDRTYHCKPEAPKCEGTVTLNPGDEVIRRAAKRWRPRGTNQTYCSVECSDGAKPVQKNGTVYMCPVTAPTCEGTVVLDVNDQIWKKGDTGWKKQNGDRLYCDVTCAEGSTLTHKQGDTHYCKAEAPTCEGVATLNPGDEVIRRGAKRWRPRGTNQTYCSVECSDGAKPVQKNGTVYMCPVTAPKCEGTVVLDVNDQIWKKGDTGWKKQNGDRLYCDVTCAEGSTLTHKQGDTHYCKAEAPTCEGVATLNPGDEVIRRGAKRWRPRGTNQTYCSVECSDGAKPVQKNGTVYMCPVTAPKCEGTVVLNVNDQIWKKGDTGWKKQNGDRLYCDVTCAEGSTLTHKQGDTHYCKAEAPTCEGVATLNPGDEVIRRGAKRWRPRGTNQTYCSVECSDGAELVQKNGTVYMCPVTAPKCEGVSKLDVNDQIWKKGDTGWKQRNNGRLYCEASCAEGSTLTHKQGDTHYCKAEAPTCEGVATLNPGDEVIRRGAKRWRPRGTNQTYCSVECSDGAELVQKNGTVYMCPVTAPKCEGVSKLDVNDQIWKKGDTGWKQRNNDRLYYEASCAEGSTLTHKQGDTHYCKADPASGCNRNTKILTGSQRVIKGTDGFWRLQNKRDEVYCEVACKAGKELKRLSGQKYRCR